MVLFDEIATTKNEDKHLRYIKDVNPLFLVHQLKPLGLSEHDIKISSYTF